jgi:hypothetical protein
MVVNHLKNDDVLNEAYRLLVAQAIDRARGILESGGKVDTQVMLLAKEFNHSETHPIDTSSERAKLADVSFIRQAAERLDAKVAVLLTEAWRVDATSGENLNNVYARHESLQHHPKGYDALEILIETPLGLWTATAKIRRKYPSIKRRTFAPFTIMRCDSASGSMTNFLPQLATQH